MAEPPSPTKAQRRRLEAFLARPDIAEHALTYGQLQGFLFTIASAPDLVPPSEWMDFVFGEAEPVFSDEKEASDILGAVMAIYNEINLGVLDGAPLLPEDCALRDDPIANLEPDAPVAEWCEGFRLGHGWLEGSWDVPMDEETDKELGACLTTLMFFSSRAMAEELRVEFGSARPLEESARTFHRLFENAMASYALVGRSIYEARYLNRAEDSPDSPADAPPVARRNDPCPCGSGRKFKRCCGRHVH